MICSIGTVMLSLCSKGDQHLVYRKSFICKDGSHKLQVFSLTESYKKKNIEII